MAKTRASTGLKGQRKSKNVKNPSTRVITSKTRTLGDEAPSNSQNLDNALVPLQIDDITVTRCDEETTGSISNEYLSIGSRSSAVPSTIPPSTRKAGEWLKLAKDLIPEFDGSNMPVNMFAEQCRAAAALLEPHELAYLVIMIRNKVIGPARKHIQDRVGINLEEILRILQNVFMPREDTSQLTQMLANIHRKSGESIADYGTRVSCILNKITIKVMEKNPGEKGKERCAEYTENTIKNFIRGLDKDTLSFIKNKFPPTLDTAIELAAEADQENCSWKRVHDKERISYPIENNRKHTIAHINGKRGDDRSQRLSSIQCFNCKEMGHFKRDCSHFERNLQSKNVGSAKGCTYCSYKNHTVDECRLKKRHYKERQGFKKPRFGNQNNKGDLNSNRDHRRGAPVSSTQTTSPNNASLSASRNQVIHLPIQQ